MPLRVASRQDRHVATSEWRAGRRSSDKRPLHTESDEENTETARCSPRATSAAPNHASDSEVHCSSMSHAKGRNRCWDALVGQLLQVVGGQPVLVQEHVVQGRPVGALQTSLPPSHSVAREPSLPLTGSSQGFGSCERELSSLPDLCSFRQHGYWHAVRRLHGSAGIADQVRT